MPVILHNPAGVFPPYRKPALTVICCQRLDPRLKLEMEAIAAG